MLFPQTAQLLSLQEVEQAAGHEPFDPALSHSSPTSTTPSPQEGQLLFVQVAEQAAGQAPFEPPLSQDSPDSTTEFPQTEPPPELIDIPGI